MSNLYDPDTSYALSASAGSGKTFALTTRLLGMLLTGVSPREIIAITFTNLAANEIRSGLSNASRRWRKAVWRRRVSMPNF